MNGKVISVILALLAGISLLTAIGALVALIIGVPDSFQALIIALLGLFSFGVLSALSLIVTSLIHITTSKEKI